MINSTPIRRKLKSFIYSVATALAIAFLISGCAQKNKPKTADRNIKKTQISENYPIIRKLNSETMTGMIKNRNGKILIINLWSTWSAKSMNQLLILNGLYEKYKNNLADFAVITIDPNSDIDSKVVPFIKKENINLPVYMIDSAYGKQIMNMLNPSWTGSIPVIYFYNQKGIQKIMLQGMQTQAEIEKAINDLTN